MAQPALRLAHNQAGNFFVDSTCIDCDTCRWMAPEVFTRREAQASVAQQPSNPQARRRALMALVSCPTSSIGTEGEESAREVLDALPEEIEVDGSSGVYHCGYHHESSFGAASYLIVRPDERGGNVLIDSPRFTRPLVRRLEDLGGVRTLFLTHKDDIADHERFAEHFACERILHAADATRETQGIERWIEGNKPLALDPEIDLIPVPGHTRGSVVLLWRQRFLFTGDHLAWSARLNHVYGFRSACWYDWNTLIASTERLASHPFEWILPGHGRRCHFTKDAMRAHLETCLAWMRSV